MLNCDQHDYIEIACLFQYIIKLKLKSGDVLEGIAIDIQLNERKQECIKISSGKTSTLVILDTISSMESQIENPHFKKLNFE